MHRCSALTRKGKRCTLNAQEDEGMTNLADKVETGLSGRLDKLEIDMNMECWAVKTEMDVLNKLLREDGLRKGELEWNAGLLFYAA